MAQPLTPYQRAGSGNQEFEAIVCPVITRFDDIVRTLQRSHGDLYQFLGCVYEAAAKIDAGFGLRALLDIEVSKAINHARKKRSKFKPEAHDTFDLLLVLRTGLEPDLKFAKCRWLASLRAAEERKASDGSPDPVPRTEEDFVEWITPIGVSGAWKLMKNTKFRPSLSDLVEGIAAESPTLEIELPRNVDPPEGMVIILGRIVDRQTSKASVAVVDVITEEKRVRNMTAWSLGKREAEQMKHEKALGDAVQKALKKEFGDPGEPEAEVDMSLANGEFFAEIERNL
jgi:hypothetical protein